MASDFPILQVGTYRHNKTGKLYEVLGIALHTETDEPLVVYRPLYHSEYPLFTRPYEMFTEMVPQGNEEKPRFEKVDDGILDSDINGSTTIA